MSRVSRFRWGMTAMIIRGDPTPTDDRLPDGSAESDRRLRVRRDGARRDPGLRGVGGPRGARCDRARRDAALLRDDAPGRHDDALRRWPAPHDARQRRPHAEPIRDLVLQGDYARSQDVRVRASSENGGEVNLQQTVNVVPAMSNADLVQTAMTMNPPAPIRAPGTTFSVTDTVHNAGTARSGALDDALLPVARCGEERRRHAPDREPLGPRSGSRGEPFRDGHGDHPRGHAAQCLLPARLCR